MATCALITVVYTIKSIMLHLPVFLLFFYHVISRATPAYNILYISSFSFHQLFLSLSNKFLDKNYSHFLS
jgi:hypothetical protein